MENVILSLTMTFSAVQYTSHVASRLAEILLGKRFYPLACSCDLPWQRQNAARNAQNRHDRLIALDTD